jgi:RinA family phage transcriptional activator
MRDLQQCHFIFDGHGHGHAQHPPRPARQTRAGLRSETFDRLEAELRDYQATKTRIAELVADISERGAGIAYDVQTHEQHASPEWSDPTPKRASALAQHRLLERMRAAVDAIDRLLERLPASDHELVREFYWDRRPRRQTALVLSLSESTLRRRRHAIVEALAEEMGEW